MNAGYLRPTREEAQEHWQTRASLTLSGDGRLTMKGSHWAVDANGFPCLDAPDGTLSFRFLKTWDGIVFAEPAHERRRRAY